MQAQPLAPPIGFVTGCDSVSFTATAGQTYYIVVEYYGINDGWDDDFNISLSGC